MAKPGIQSTIFASHQPITQEDNIRAFSYNFYTFIIVEYHQYTGVINNVIDYVLCFVLSNELFIKSYFTVVSTMGKISYKDKMRIQTLREMGFGLQSYCCKIYYKHFLNNLKLMS